MIGVKIMTNQMMMIIGRQKLRKVFFFGNYLMKASLNQKLHSKGPVACSNRGG